MGEALSPLAFHHVSYWRASCGTSWPHRHPPPFRPPPAPARPPPPRRSCIPAIIIDDVDVSFESILDYFAYTIRIPQVAHLRSSAGRRRCRRSSCCVAAAGGLLAAAAAQSSTPLALLALPQADAEKLPEILLSVSEERRAEMRGNLVKVWQR